MNSTKGPMMEAQTADAPFFSIATCRAGSPTTRPVSIAGSANTAQTA